MSIDVASSMHKILNSDRNKHLFGTYKKASDDTYLEKNPSELLAKYPHVMQLLSLLDAESKFPALMGEINNNRFGENNPEDVDMAHDDEALQSEVNAVKSMLDALDQPEISAELASLLRDMGLSSEEVSPIEDSEDLVVTENLEGMGDLPVAEEEPVMDYTAADLAIDSLLTASAALDELNLSKSSKLSLEMAAKIIEAKKKSKKDKEDDKEDKEDKEDDKKDKKDKKDKDDDKKDKKDKKDKDDDKKDKKDKKEKDDEDKDEDKKDKKKSKKGVNPFAKKDDKCDEDEDDDKKKK